MAIQTLADVREEVKQWSNRQNIDNQRIDNFINIALTNAMRDLRIPVLEGIINISPNVNGNYNIPTDYLSMISVTINSNSDYIALERKDLNSVFISNLKSNGQLKPRFFSRRGFEFIVDQKTGDDEIIVYYYRSLDPLINDNDTNWFVTDAPDLLLYGALAELSLYTEDEDNQVKWQAKYNNVLVRIQNMEDKAAISGDTLSVSVEEQLD